MTIIKKIKSCYDFVPQRSGERKVCSKEWRESPSLHSLVQYISVLEFNIMISLRDRCCNKEVNQPRVTIGEVLIRSPTTLRMSSRVDGPL